MSNAKRLVVTILLGFVLAVLMGVVTAVIIDVPKFYRLTKYAHLVDGTVTSLERENHRAVLVRYKVEGQNFETAGQAESVGKSFETIQIGDIAPVYYDPSNPTTSTLGKPNRYLHSSLMGTGFVFIGVLFSFLLFVIKSRITKNNLRDSSSN